ncbi:hypothetical protein [Curtobacterium sp. Leaf261]|uniref:hypothetical protein n=1 Tax=Curtobacterium sp. Leaf261 TaxID=1736311 RepID=UPI000701CF1E|nr:hypothetical protein [Curtobacterium sp. Leaf261]KQO62120.1 hypothetical protein ASF23_09780 [Curtobacterium sp. Leaf261]
MRTSEAADSPTPGPDADDPRPAPDGRSAVLGRSTLLRRIAPLRSLLLRSLLLRLAIVYLAGRIVSLAALGVAYLVGLRVGHAPILRLDQGFLGFMTTWDGGYYRQIAETGYPLALPIGPDGAVTQNAWAFLPVYPMICRALMAIGIPFDGAAIGVSVVAGFGAVVACHAVMRRVFGDVAAGRGAVLIAFAPLAFLFQVAYAESTFLALMALGVLFLLRRRYWLLLAVVVLASFTRPGAVALPAALAVVLVVRLVQRRVRWPEAVTMVVTGLLGAAAGVAWPIVAGIATGRPSAYVDTEMAWWRFAAGERFVPFAAAFRQADRQFDWIGVVAVGVVVLVVAVLAVRGTRRLGLPFGAYCVAYVVYLLAVFLPQTSTLRLLMPLAPISGHPLVTATRTRFGVVLGVAVVAQFVLCPVLWTFGTP